MKVNIYFVIWCPFESRDLMCQARNSHVTQKEYVFVHLNLKNVKRVEDELT